MERLRSVLLTLWDIARGNPGYDRKLWSELQFLQSDLETRNEILCTLISDLMRAAESSPGSPDEALTLSPPQGYAVEFFRKELARGEKPRAAVPFSVVDELMNIESHTKNPDLAKRRSGDLTIDRTEPEPSPQTGSGRYDGDDESLEDSSDELLFDYGTTD